MQMVEIGIDHFLDGMHAKAQELGIRGCSLLAIAKITSEGAEILDQTSFTPPGENRDSYERKAQSKLRSRLREEHRQRTRRENEARKIPATEVAPISGDLYIVTVFSGPRSGKSKKHNEIAQSGIGYFMSFTPGIMGLTLDSYRRTEFSPLQVKSRMPVAA